MSLSKHTAKVGKTITSAGNKLGGLFAPILATGALSSGIIAGLLRKDRRHVTSSSITPTNPAFTSLIQKRSFSYDSYDPFPYHYPHQVFEPSNNHDEENSRERRITREQTHNAFNQLANRIVGTMIEACEIVYKKGSDTASQKALASINTILAAPALSGFTITHAREYEDDRLLPHLRMFGEDIGITITESELKTPYLKICKYPPSSDHLNIRKTIATLIKDSDLNFIFCLVSADRLVDNKEEEKYKDYLVRDLIDRDLDVLHKLASKIPQQGQTSAMSR